MNYKPENRIPWLLTDFDNINDFPWLLKKFPDFSLTLKNFRFSLTFPWPWQPRNRRKEERGAQGGIPVTFLPEGKMCRQQILNSIAFKNYKSDSLESQRQPFGHSCSQEFQETGPKVSWF